MDPITLIMLAVLALLIFFMFRNSRKRQRDLAEMADKTRPGARVMTNFGLFGTLISVDEESNVAEVETSPGTIVRVHRQTLSRVVEDTATAADATADELPADSTLGDETPAVSLDKPATDPTRRPAKSDGAE